MSSHTVQKQEKQEKPKESTGEKIKSAFTDAPSKNEGGDMIGVGSEGEPEGKENPNPNTEATTGPSSAQ